ncbi:uncharacterized protein LOC135200692 [Macrobrachium nipponense]|uniref:uncharacterized protein LOC135200692 n=1 Tax=Macrobrachium nipponense TaxID=159736 RepID=UPI0030C83444
MLREEVRIRREQLGFMEGSGTTDRIFCIRQLIEKFREKQRDLHLVFIDLEKAYGRVSRQEIWRCLREKLTPENYVRIIQMYRNVYTRLRSSVGETDGFEIRVDYTRGNCRSMRFTFCLRNQALSTLQSGFNEVVIGIQRLGFLADKQLSVFEANA